MLLKTCLLFVFVITCSLNLLPLIHAQNDNPPGFISIDCGLPEGSNYKDTATGIYYISDAKLIDSGESQRILPSSNPPEKHLSTLRSFPQGIRNCYTLQPSPGIGYKYLIRASFIYGNYDSINQLPSFSLNLGVDIWDTIDITDQSTPIVKEIIHTLYSDYIHICLVKTGRSTPFISALELRLLNSTNGMYTVSPGSLQTYDRVNFNGRTTQTIRYKDDIYDRTWRPLSDSRSTTISTLFDINNRNDYLVPVDVMRTAIKPDNTSDHLEFKLDVANASDNLYIYLHFSEVEILEANQSREFNVYINDKLWNSGGPVVPIYLTITTYFPTIAKTGVSSYNLTLTKTQNSTLPPIINAAETYKEKKFSNLQTNETDVAAILGVKSTYGVKRDWQGDPCEPEEFLWDGLNCSYSLFDSARIISLDLSKSKLSGEIAPSIANLTKLRTLDLSNNNLSGQVPHFLSQLDLSVLNLKGNNFSGPFPAQLLEKQKNGILSLSFDGPGNNTNADTCRSQPCKKKSNKATLVVVAAVVGSLIFLSAILFGVWMMKRKKILQASIVTESDNGMAVDKGDIERKNRQFTYSEVLNITTNFQRVLGKGGFGTVYHGYVGETQVAVKMLSPLSTQGYKEFQTEATVLMNVHHKNLTTLVGYCNEGTNMGIIYEYMVNRSLDEHLSGRSDSFLSWETRLQIAVDAAQGLEYLHHGCKPAIIHRDIKTSNILLNEKFQAKLADFGLSKSFPLEGATHVSTVVAGTPGYLDFDYYTSNRLTEKSDVFSFGVVLLEIITGRPAILIDNDKAHISEWVDSIVQNGDVKQVMDSRFRGKFNVNSAWKAVELAMACASRDSLRRPTMNVVVTELKECLAIEGGSHVKDSTNSTEMVMMDVESSLIPRAR